MTPHDCPFVFVLWVDAVTRTQDGWMSAEEDDADGVEEVWSAGFMVKRTRKEVKIVGDMGMDGTYNRRISIPTGMIRAIRSKTIDGELLYERRTRAKKVKKSKGWTADNKFLQDVGK